MCCEPVKCRLSPWHIYLNGLNIKNYLILSEWRIFQIFWSIYSQLIEITMQSPLMEVIESKQAFTLDDIVSNATKNDAFDGAWISETEIFHRVNDSLEILDVTTMENDILTEDSLFSESGTSQFLSPDRKYVLVQNSKQKVYRHSSTSVYSIYNLENKSIVKLAEGKPLKTAFWAPKESALVYVLDNDIYYCKISVDKSETRRLTFDGKYQEIFNGVPDWIYEEEVYGSDKTMWFSPSGEHLAFAKFNDFSVSESVIMRYGKPGTIENQYPKEERFRYPKVGTTNPQVSLNIIDLRNDASAPVTMPIPTEIVGSEPILYTANWMDSNILTAVWTNRVQNKSQIVSYSSDGKSQNLISEEVPNGWLMQMYTSLSPIYHKDYALMIKTQPIGNTKIGSFAHVTRYTMKNGIFCNEQDLTPGEYWVHDIHGVNENKGVVYFSASPPGKPSERHLYEVNLELPKDLKPAPKCISCEFNTPEGNPCKYVSSVTFSPRCTHYALTCAGPDPATIKIYNQDHTQLHTWLDNEETRQLISQRFIPKQMNLDIEANGFIAKVRLLLPENFDPSKKYPMIVHVYSGPNSQIIVDKFKFGFELYVTTNRHMIHAWIDGRGSSTKGTEMLYAVNRDLGNAEMEDQITVTKILQQTHSWIDEKRTGVWGRSYGGYATLSILARDDENIFKCGVSVSPVTDWLYYDSIYTERYMGLPTADDNLEKYVSSGVIGKVEKLRGKKFMLIHGTADDNVHYQNAMALTKALVEAGIFFDQFTYPDESHALPNVLKHFYRTMDRYFLESFGLNDETHI